MSKASYIHSLFFMEDPEPSIGVLCTIPSVTYNPAADYSFSCAVHIVEGSVLKAPDTFFVLFFPKGGGNAPWGSGASGAPWGSGFSRNGITLTYSASADGMSLTFAVAQGATCEGSLQFRMTYKGQSYIQRLSVVRVVDGVEGPRGIQGPFIRGPRNFNDVVAAYADSSTELFYSGTGDEPFKDIVLFNGSIFQCVRTHPVRDTAVPTLEGQVYWMQLSGVDYVATMLLLAQTAKIRNLIAEGIEMRSDDAHRVVFAVYKDSEGKGVVYTNSGTFDNVVVEGDIQCNTLTYKSITPTDSVPLADGQHVGGIITVTPQGGCLIVPGGKSDVDILLPPVEEGTVRQITVINQYLPFHRMNYLEAQNGRHVYIRTEEENVCIFKGLEDPTFITSDNTQLYDLAYGAYNLYGYRAKIYDEDAEGNERDITAWSIWKTDQPVAEPRTFEPFTPSSTTTIGGYQKTLQNGLPPIRTL